MHNFNQFHKFSEQNPSQAANVSNSTTELFPDSIALDWGAGTALHTTTTLRPLCCRSSGILIAPLRFPNRVWMVLYNGSNRFRRGCRVAVTQNYLSWFLKKVRGYF